MGSIDEPKPYVKHIFYRTERGRRRRGRMKYWTSNVCSLSTKKKKKTKKLLSLHFSQIYFKPCCHIQFLHAFSALRCIFEELKLVYQTKIVLHVNVTQSWKCTWKLDVATHLNCLKFNQTSTAVIQLKSKWIADKQSLSYKAKRPFFS